MRVTAYAVGGDWTCEAVLDPALSENDRDAFDLLMVDPLWTLCFGGAGDDLRVDVTSVDGDRLALRPRPDPQDREGDLMRADDAMEWQKSSFSGNGPGNDCVEVAGDCDRIRVREGDDPYVVLAPTDRAFGALLRHVKGQHA